ncbi:MAG: NAD(P)-dependent oxidoreductase [Thermoplasmatales archaeon]
MTRKILVIGGSGFIGSHLLEELLTKNYLPVVYVRNSSNLWRIDKLIDRMTIFDETISIEEIFKKHDLEAVINLSTYYKKNHEFEDIAQLLKTNIELPTKVLEFCKVYEVKKFISAGSYFQYSNYTTLSNNIPFIARDLYAATKSALDKIMEYYNFNTEVKTLNLTLFTPYGEKDHVEKLIPYVIYNALKRNRILLSCGFQRLMPVYVKDVASAFVNAVSTNWVSDSTDIHIPIVGNFSYSVREIVSLIEELLGYEIEKKWCAFGVDKVDDDKILMVDTGKSQKSIGWKAETDLRDGLAKTIAYFGGKVDEDREH